MLDDVEDVPVGLGGGRGEIAGADEEERRAPRAAAVDAVAAGAERYEEPLAAGRADRRPRVVQDPGETAGQNTETAESEGQDQQRPSHSAGRD